MLGGGGSNVSVMFVEDVQDVKTRSKCSSTNLDLQIYK